MFGLDFHVYSIFCLHRALYKIHSWNLFAHEKIKSERKSVVKKEKKKETGPKKKESTILSRREKISLWTRLVLAELLAGEQRTKNKEVAVKPKFAMHDVKNEVFFCLQVPALVQNINQWQEEDK